MQKNVLLWGMVALVALVVACTIFIFSNSIKDAQASHEDSAVVTEIVEPVLENVFNVEPENTEHIVRKCAHFIEFALLGVLLVALVFLVQYKYNKTFVNIL